MVTHAPNFGGELALGTLGGTEDSGNRKPMLLLKVPVTADEGTLPDPVNLALCSQHNQQHSSSEAQWYRRIPCIGDVCRTVYATKEA